MWYYGKNRDTFAAAFAYLLENSHVAQIPYIDCISGRPFRMRCAKDVRYWFETAVTVPQAVKNINAFIFGGEDVIKCVETGALAADDDRRRLLTEGCVLGPVRGDAVIPHLQDRFYRGCHHFYFLKCDKIGPAEITDPLGTPLYYEKARDTGEIFGRGEYVIWASPVSARSEAPQIDWHGVLEKGFDSRRRYREHPCSIQNCAFEEIYLSGSSAHTSLHMALNHYTCQLAGISNLLDARTKNISFQRKTKELFSWVSSIKHTENVQEIRKLDDRIWEMYYEQFCAFSEMR